MSDRWERGASDSDAAISGEAVGQLADRRRGGASRKAGANRASVEVNMVAMASRRAEEDLRTCSMARIFDGRRDRSRRAVGHESEPPPSHQMRCSTSSISLCSASRRPPRYRERANRGANQAAHERPRT